MEMDQKITFQFTFNNTWTDYDLEIYTKHKLGSSENDQNLESSCFGGRRRRGHCLSKELF